MPDNELLNQFGAERIGDRQVSEALGIARGLIADGVIVQVEAEFLRRWLEAQLSVNLHPVLRILNDRIRLILADGILDKDEANDLYATLSAFAGGDFERGEIVKSTTLPLCHPAPPITFIGSSFCFTGTFAFGPRKDCEAAISARGSFPGTLTAKTNYLVVGAYATDSWAQSSFGRKIEKAAEMRQKGIPIRIVGEDHWIAEMSRP